MKVVAGSLVSITNWFTGWIVSYLFNFMLIWSQTGTLHKMDLINQKYSFVTKSVSILFIFNFIYINTYNPWHLIYIHIRTRHPCIFSSPSFLINQCNFFVKKIYSSSLDMLLDLKNGIYYIWNSSLKWGYLLINSILIYFC